MGSDGCKVDQLTVALNIDWPAATRDVKGVRGEQWNSTAMTTRQRREWGVYSNNGIVPRYLPSDNVSVQRLDKEVFKDWAERPRLETASGCDDLLLQTTLSQQHCE